MFEHVLDISLSSELETGPSVQFSHSAELGTELSIQFRKGSVRTEVQN
jgi:hypothetical protein